MDEGIGEGGTKGGVGQSCRRNVGKGEKRRRWEVEDKYEGVQGQFIRKE